MPVTFICCLYTVLEAIKIIVSIIELPQLNPPKRRSGKMKKICDKTKSVPSTSGDTCQLVP